MTAEQITAVLMVTFVVGMFLAAFGGQLLGWWER